jgi:hypothetical protein
MKAGIVEPEKTSIARQLLSNQVPVEMNMHTTIEDPISKQWVCNNSRGIVGNCVFYLVHTAWL